MLLNMAQQLSALGVIVRPKSAQHRRLEIHLD
jgi:hypothetical protein